MESPTENDELVESAIEFEDLELSDTENPDNEEFEAIPLTIDGNSRIISNASSVYSSDMQLCERESNCSAFQSSGADLSRNTSSEDLNVSDDEALVSSSSKLKEINLDSVTCRGIRRHFETSSSFDHSSTVFKEGPLTDSEYISDDEINKFDNRHSSANDSGIKYLTSGLSVAGVFASVKDFFSGKPDSVKENTTGDGKPPLMTCVEFLKADHSEDEITDEEEFSMDLGNVTEHHEPIYTSVQSNQDHCTLEAALRNRGKGESMSKSQNNARKASWTTELLSDDESTTVYSRADKLKNRKRNSLANVVKDPDECLTDEEVVDLEDKEWTETDESGGVRQVTQIKTETSIKLEDAVKSLKKVPEKETTPDKSSTESEADDLSFTEKKTYFQRLSLTSDKIPGTNQYIQDVSLDDLPMAEGEIIEEKISFEDKLKMFEPDDSNRKKIQKRDKPEQPTVYHYDFTKNGKDKMDITPEDFSTHFGTENISDKMGVISENGTDKADITEYAISRESKDRMDATEYAISELEKAEEIVKQVNEEILEEENRFTEESAITLEKVEQEVYSLIAEVDKEERKLHDVCYDSGNKNGASESEEHSVMEEETKSSLSQQMLEQEAVLEAEDYVTSARDQPLTEATHSASSEGISAFPDSEKDFHSRNLSLELCRKDELHEAIKLDEDDGVDIARPTSVDSHIKSEILQEEIDQSIEESPLEVKHIVEELEEISASDDHKCDVYKQIRTEIFSQELGADIESGSPERKELGTFSSKKSDSSSDSEDDKPDNSSEFVEHGNSELLSSGLDVKGKMSDVLATGVERETFYKGMSPQVSEDSCGPTDEISSEGVVVEPDEQLFDYEEAKDEHSLTEQLQALASDASNSAKKIISDPLHSMEFGDHEFDHLKSGMSSSISDLEVHRRSKEIAFSRHDKKEIRSLKSTKQVSTIEEHSSIESCDSPQDLMLQELPEKSDAKEGSDAEDDTNQLIGSVGYSEKTFSTVPKGSTSADFSTNKDQGSSPENEKSNLPSSSEYDADACVVPRLSDNSDKSSKISRSDSKSLHSKKSDSETEGSKIDSSGSGKVKEESCSSSGETESPYYSVETSDSGRTPRSTPAASRPCSSEFDINVFSGHGSEYETCVTSQGTSGEASGSYATAVSSQEISYSTACSSFSHSSRESAYSIDSESSGHLASIEVSSEASETLMPPANEELEFAPDIEMPVLDEEPADEDSMKEPYDMDIPDDVIRSGVEVPFLKNWDLNDSTVDESEKMKQLPQQWSWQFASESEVTDTFETLESKDDDLNECKSELESVDAQIVESSANAKVLDTTPQFAQVGTSYSLSGHSHRRSVSSVRDINLDREPMEQNATIVDEEQLSVSESSATHSEQTWQTSSIDTAVLLSSHAPLSTDGPNMMLDSFQETPPEKELTTELGNSSNLDSSYLQLNGPVEVDYNPDFDNPDDGDSELTSNQVQSSTAYETEGLQFDLEMEGSFSASDAANATGDTLDDLETNLENISGVDDGNIQSVLEDHQTTHSSTDFDLQNTISSDADQPEAQQEQSLSFRSYEPQESESFVCSDLTSYLPESEQGDLLSNVVDSLPPSLESEINIPIAGSASSNEGLSNVETRINILSDLAVADSTDRVEAVDTSPEDERYEYKSLKTSLHSPKEENADFSDLSPSSHDNIFNPESDFTPQSFTSKYDEVPGADLYTHHEEQEYGIRRTNLSPILSVEGSTPSSLPSRKFFSRSGETSAASSLQEFERLEADILGGRVSRSSIDSIEKIGVTKSGEHDDVSMSSLTEFEKVERECVDSAQENRGGLEDIMMLSEIEEGLESQGSDALEIIQEGADASEYERRRLDIEQVIKVAQCNVEKFQEETFSEGITSDECTVLLRVESDIQDLSSEETKASSKEEGNTEDLEESEHLALTLENDSITGGHDSSDSGEKNCVGRLDCMVSSTDSMDPSSSTATHATYQFETDSAMSSSLNSAQASGEECTMVSSTDTLEPEYKLTYSHGDSGPEDKTQVTSRGDESIVHSKGGALECQLRELQSTNGAKQQMEMFLSKLTDDTVLMDDFASHSFPDALEESELPPDDLLQTNEAAHGVSSSGDSSVLDGDGLVSTTTSTTTRVVTSVVGDPDGQTDFQSTFMQQLSDDDIRQSCKITVSESSPTKPDSDEDE
ncbi:hypothetical protein JTE90_025918 [Oedothorax gibbosus]|uniref:Uncharacterized protein n=1 Tax=Oedothorax gibbosus TaxID=931172 RepID=A0AAV6UUU6_9ARAC|nr:hypothetical protein JTE90_025918 [Oedothorax gibbosus]